MTTTRVDQAGALHSSQSTPASKRPEPHDDDDDYNSSNSNSSNSISISKDDEDEQDSDDNNSDNDNDNDNSDSYENENRNDIDEDNYDHPTNPNRNTDSPLIDPEKVLFEVKEPVENDDSYNNNNNNNNNKNDDHRNERRSMIGNDNDNEDNNDKRYVKIAWNVGCLVVVLVVIGLLASCFRKVEETQYGLLYTRWSKQLDDEAQSGGLFPGPPGFRFIKFPSTFVTVDLNDRKCVSRDGLIVEFSVTFQYQMTAENMHPAVERYRDFEQWDRIVTEAGLSAIHHSCSDFQISNFQNKRGEIQSVMEGNLRLKLEGNVTADIDDDGFDGNRGVYARAISLQLRNLELPEEYSDAVREKQSAEEDIALAINQRQQETTRARTALLRAREEARKILDTANNDVAILLTEARLAANETAYAFEQEARTLVDAKTALGLSTDGVLAYLGSSLLEDETKPLVVTTGEPARISRARDLSTTVAIGGGGAA